MKHVQIFFITRSLKSHYFLAFKFVSRIDFLKRSEMGKNIYPSYLRK